MGPRFPLSQICRDNGAGCLMVIAVTIVPPRRKVPATFAPRFRARAPVSRRPFVQFYRNLVAPRAARAAAVLYAYANAGGARQPRGTIFLRSRVRRLRSAYKFAAIAGPPIGIARPYDSSLIIRYRAARKSTGIVRHRRGPGLQEASVITCTRRGQYSDGVAHIRADT